MADLGGGDGGDASPPTSLKVTILVEKSASISNNSAPVRVHPPHQPKPNEPGRKITLNFGEDLFFFFGDHLILGEKNAWISDFGRKITLNFGEDLFFFFWRPPDFGRKKVWISAFSRKITLNFGEDIRIFEVLCLKSPPPKFSRSATDEKVMNNYPDELYAPVIFSIKSVHIFILRWAWGLLFLFHATNRYFFLYCDENQRIYKCKQSCVKFFTPINVFLKTVN